MGEFVNLVKDIFIFQLILQLIVNIVPEKSYRKYMELFAGFVLLILMIMPFIKVFGQLDGYLENYEKYEIRSENEDMNNLLVMYDENARKAVMQEYTEAMKETIKGFVEEQGMYLEEVIPEFSEEDYTLQGMTVYVSRKYKDEGRIEIERIYLENNEETIAESYEEIVIKNNISDFYNIGKDNINIIINGGR